MTAPDELRQLADHLDDTCDRRAGLSWDDVRAAAVALRHHANLLDAIGDPYYIRVWLGVLGTTPTALEREAFARLRRIADALDDAAAVSPPPAPTTCPTCGSDNPRQQHAVESWISDTIRCDEPCPDPWHQAAPTTCPTCGSDRADMPNMPCLRKDRGPDSWHQTAT